MVSNKETATSIELYPGLPSYCLIYPFSVIITEFRNKRLKRLKNSKYISVDKKTGLKIWHTPRLNLTIYQGTDKATIFMRFIPIWKRQGCFSSELEIADFGLTIKKLSRAESQFFLSRKVSLMVEEPALSAYWVLTRCMWQNMVFHEKKNAAMLVAFTLTRLTQSGYWRWFSTVSRTVAYVRTCVRACATLHILLLFYLRA